MGVKSLDAYQEINITIKGTGRQQIVYEDSKYKPNKILINGIPQDYTDFYVNNLPGGPNIITMRWDNKLTSCFKMFYELNNIIDFNFSYFDTSQVENMYYMFCYLNSIKTLDLSNLNKSSVKDMQYICFMDVLH